MIERDGYVELSIEEFTKLLYDSRFLGCLEAAGLDNAYNIVEEAHVIYREEFGE